MALSVEVDTCEAKYLFSVGSRVKGFIGTGTLRLLPVMEVDPYARSLPVLLTYYFRRARAEFFFSNAYRPLHIKAKGLVLPTSQLELFSGCEVKGLQAEQCEDKWTLPQQVK